MVEEEMKQTRVTATETVRSQSLLVPCRACNQPTGEFCKTKNGTRTQLAHSVRLRDMQEFKKAQKVEKAAARVAEVRESLRGTKKADEPSIIDAQLDERYGRTSDSQAVLDVLGKTDGPSAITA
jgi:hypothetical protein